MVCTPGRNRTLLILTWRILTSVIMQSRVLTTSTQGQMQTIFILKILFSWSRFNLYAVSNHFGSLEGGHYTAYCSSDVLKKWYKFDDQVSSLAITLKKLIVLFISGCVSDGCSRCSDTSSLHSILFSFRGTNKFTPFRLKRLRRGVFKALSRFCF